MTMKPYKRPVPAPFVDPVPGAVMKARQMHLDDPNHAHFCVVQDFERVTVIRDMAGMGYRSLYSTRGEEDKKVFQRTKYH